jgi:2-C-methyl-D-erythritol 2,4-cyclodiphosphate synthase
MTFRIGYGYDAHCLVEGRKLILGGIEIPHKKGLLGHSDADVLTHAICDALLGAAALGDIGKHFPDTSIDYAGIDSTLLLAQVVALLKEKGYSIGNIDATLRLQKPKISPYIDKMRMRIAEVMKISVEQVSVKASTTEKMGFEGLEEGVSASAVVLIEAKSLR